MSGKEQTPASSPSCLPRFSSPRLLSPGYFSRMTPRTREALGDEDYAQQLVIMRERFPGRPDHDMAPFLRVHHVSSQHAGTD